MMPFLEFFFLWTKILSPTLDFLAPFFVSGSDSERELGQMLKI